MHLEEYKSPKNALLAVTRAGAQGFLRCCFDLALSDGGMSRVRPVSLERHIFPTTSRKRRQPKTDCIHSSSWIITKTCLPLLLCWCFEGFSGSSGGHSPYIWPWRAVQSCFEEGQESFWMSIYLLYRTAVLIESIVSVRCNSRRLKLQLIKPKELNDYRFQKIHDCLAS